MSRIIKLEDSDEEIRQWGRDAVAEGKAEADCPFGENSAAGRLWLDGFRRAAWPSGRAYYNEHDSKKAAWLRELIQAGLIAPGDVDERDIQDVLPRELIGYTQCHFFAGVGVWSRALRRAGWPDGRPVWTGSCPCQPFSTAGKGAGFADERHLWPAFHWLVSQCRPDVVFGEQVESTDGRSWLDLVQSDLEASAYAVGPVGLCAAGFGAPHIRHRFFFVADAASDNQRRIRQSGEGDGWRELSAGRFGTVSGLADALPAGRAKGWGESRSGQVAGGGEFSHLANANSSGRKRTGSAQSEKRQGDFVFAGRSESDCLGNTEGDGWARRENDGNCRGRERAFRQASEACGLGDASSTGLQVRESGELQGEGWGTEGRAVTKSGATNGFWADAEWLYCRDGKYRAVEPGAFPLAHGAAERVGRLRGYGDAIVAPVAEEFIRAYLETGRGER
jgi:DNA (cytosine-5)-methyltransferase 1